MPHGKPALVILAAGASSRLGTCKALVSLRPERPGSPLELLLEAGAGLDDVPPLIVSGRHHPEIAAAAPRGPEVLHNPAWSEGRTGGVRLAAQARPGLDLCLAPVDVPLVPRCVFDALCARWAEADAPPRGWLSPRSIASGRTGHPVVVGHELLSELGARPAGESLRRLRLDADPLLVVDVRSAAILDDLDTPSDLDRLRRGLRGNEPR